jgi:tetratricopeptide (TPR) repeat protein
VTTFDDELERAYATHGAAPGLIAALEDVLGRYPVDPARAAFERAGVRDYLGHEADAVPLYREALDRGLAGPERLQCLVQLGSSLRNVGAHDEAVRVLRAAGAEAPEDERAWADAFLALALYSSGRPGTALSVALAALAPHLTRYGRAVAAYADELQEAAPRDGR